jgi:AcrR family transcriptional regulator
MVQTGKRERRTQAERTASTRAALLDAAIECLADLGYAGTTTTEVARRAGVSRGAQLHHFPSKADLLVAATDHVLERRLAEFAKAFADAPPGVDQIDWAVDVLWSMYSGGTFVSALELLVAARADETLRPAVVEQQQRFFEGAARQFAELFADSLAPDAETGRLNLAFAFALLDGVALQELLSGPKLVPSQSLVDALKVVAHLITPVPEEHP